MAPDPMWSVDQTAKHLNLAPITVRRMIQRGELRAYRVARTIRIDPRDARKALKPVTRIGGAA